MSSSTASTVKFALLAYSVYCWVDGSARTRHHSGSSSGFDLDTLGTNEPRSPPNEPASRGRFRAFWGWLLRRGPPISEEEQATIGKVDMATAFLLFNLIQRLTSPKRSSRHILPTVTLPSPGTARGLCWKTLVMTTALLSLLHETRRAGVLHHLRARRADVASRIQKDLAHMRIGQVLVRGTDVAQPTDQTPDDEEECLICSGSAETMSTSSHGGSSRGLGPLEAFCTNAPDKHLSHRSCFLRWHAAYIQQRPDHRTVSLIDSEGTQANESFIRASIILRAAGFEYLLPRLKPEPIQEQDRDTLTLSRHGRDEKLLATLRTSAPPCPGCRSPVSLCFIDSRPSSVPMSALSAQQPPHSFLCEWSYLVTGRTLGGYFGSLLSFMAVLAAITKARENPSAFMWYLS